jgi:hypothetical protein
VDTTHEADNRSLVLFDRGDEIVVQAGRRWRSLARLRSAAGGTGRLVRADSDEHVGAAPAGVRGNPVGHISKPSGVEIGIPSHGLAQIFRWNE